jgi:hypothetical protein
VFDALSSHNLEWPLGLFALVVGVIWLVGRIGWWIVWKSLLCDSGFAARSTAWPFPAAQQPVHAVDMGQFTHPPDKLPPLLSHGSYSLQKKSVAYLLLIRSSAYFGEASTNPLGELARPRGVEPLTPGSRVLGRGRRL